jgi:hypothetical protein
MICGKKEVKGIKWGEGTLMNARWTGYRLLDILAAAGLARDKDGTEQKSLHVCFASEAAPTQAEPWYGSSVPLDMVLDPARSVLLATHVSIPSVLLRFSQDGITYTVVMADEWQTALPRPWIPAQGHHSWMYRREMG